MRERNIADIRRLDAQAGERRRSVLMLPRLSSTTTLLPSMAGMQAV